MWKSKALWLTIIFILFALALARVGAAQEIITLSTRPNVTQSYFLTSAPKQPQAVAILFPGSGGTIQLRSGGGQPRFAATISSCEAARFVKYGVRAAIVDAPSDQQSGWGMGDEFRLGEEHATDIAAVVADLVKRVPNAPLFLVGTSRNHFRRGIGGALEAPMAGTVLTSSLFRASGRNSMSRTGFEQVRFFAIQIPLLFVHHVSDQCDITPYGEAARLSEKYPLISVFGGDTPRSGPCDNFSQHGYLGKESATVEQIVNWMLKKPFQTEVK
jgi:hypothetical protein